MWIAKKRLQRTIRYGMLKSMTRDPAATRSRILDAAEKLVMARGFGGTSLDAILADAGATKGAFFHHFDGKAALGKALAERFAAADAAQLEELEREAERLASDPLEQVLAMVGLVEEEMSSLEEPFPGCLVASYVYQADLFEPGTLEIGRRMLARWRDALARRLRHAAELHPPRQPIDAESLASGFTAILEGAFVLSKVHGDPRLIAEQLGHYHAYLELLFGVDG